MHFHPTPASASGDALAGYHAAETATALRRARELRDSAAKIRIDASNFSSVAAADPEAVSMVSAWSGGGGASQQFGQASQDALPQGSFSNAESPPDSGAAQPVRRVASAMPVSFWA